MLTVMACLLLAWIRSEREARQDRRLYLGALLAALSFAFAMTVENAMVSIFVTAPLGLIVK